MTTSILKTAIQSIKYWYVPAIVGTAFLFLGAYTMGAPMEAYIALSYVFSISLITAGAMDAIFTISNRKMLKGWGWTLISSLIELGIGIYLLKNPIVSAAALPFYVGFVVMFRSISAIETSFDLKQLRILNWGNLLAIGILGLVLSLVLIFNPNFAGISLVVWVGLTLLISGGLGFYLSYQLKKVHDLPKKIKKSVKKKVNTIKDKIHNELVAEHKKIERAEQEQMYFFI